MQEYDIRRPAATFVPSAEDSPPQMGE